MKTRSRPHDEAIDTDAGSRLSRGGRRHARGAVAPLDGRRQHGCVCPTRTCRLREVDRLVAERPTETLGSSEGSSARFHARLKLNAGIGPRLKPDADSRARCEPARSSDPSPTPAPDVTPSPSRLPNCPLSQPGATVGVSPRLPVIASDTAANSNPIPFWGSSPMPKRLPFHLFPATSGDPHVTATGAPQSDTAYRRLTVLDGDGFTASAASSA